MRELRENLLPHSLMIYTLNHISNRLQRNKDFLKRLMNRLSIWDWGYHAISLNLNRSDANPPVVPERPPRFELVFELLERLETDKNDRDQLEELGERLSEGCWDWVYARVQIALSVIESDFQKKAGLIETAISRLKRDCSSEIANMKLHGRLAGELADRNRFSEALYHAHVSVASHPEEAWDRSMLSYVCQNYKGLEESRSQIEICMSIDPGSDYNYESLAWSETEAIDRLRDRGARQNALKNYIEIMHRYLELLESDPIGDPNDAKEWIDKKSRVHLNLGHAYYLQGNHDASISNLIMAKCLSEGLTDRSQMIHLMSKFRLGRAYLDSNNHTECESILREVVGLSEEKLLALGSGDDAFTSRYIMAEACLCLSRSYMQRDANLADAMNLIDRAGIYIKTLTDPVQKNELEAMHDDCLGLLIYKQIKLGDGKTDIKQSIDSLERAVGRLADPEYYLHLALALECQLDYDGGASGKAESEKAGMMRTLRRAIACCNHAIELDLDNKHREEARELLKRLKNKNGKT